MAKKTLKSNPNEVLITRQNDETKASALARTCLRPSVGAAITLKALTGQYEDLELMALMDELGTISKLANDGELARAEAILVIQAHTLDAMFNNLAQKALRNMGGAGEYLSAAEIFMRLALKAQSQCRSTLETLAEIKNPMAGAYVRQANIAAGHQQVNNGTQSADEALQAREIKNQQNKLSEGSYELLPDTRPSQVESGINSQMGTLEKIHRPENRSG